MGKLFKNPLLSVSIAIVFTFTLAVFSATETSYTLIETASVWVRNHFGFFYLYLGLGCVLFLISIALSPLGRIRLGKKGSKPEHSTWAWTAMLYSAGMGSGILLRAVQEPVFMQQYPPYLSDIPRETLALQFTFYQWGFTAWAFYGLFALVIGYGLFVRKRKVLASAAVQHIVKSRVALNSIDIMTIITTVFGLIAAIGLGTAQINGGLNHLFEPDFGLGTMLLLATLISGLSFYSAWQGLNKGIKIISKINIVVTLAILFYVFLHGNIQAILGAFAQTTGHYIIDFIPMSLAWGPYDPGLAFLTDWTFYYWAFWLAWAPFTGMFIARISKGRTLRQMVWGVLIIPSLSTFFWFSVFGTSAFELIASWDTYNNEFGNVFTSIFIFFEHIPGADLLNFTTLLLLIGFLVTSVDSAVFVLSMFTDGGKRNPQKKHRLLWSIFVLMATMALLLLGNVKQSINVLDAVQLLLVITSLPFAFYMIAMSTLFLKDVLKK